MDIGPLVLLAFVAALFVRAVVVLRRRGRRVSGWQRAAFAAGLLLTAVGLVGPVDELSDELMSAHMAQHLLIADLAAPLLLAGLRTPVLQHMLPPRLLRPLARQQWLRTVLRTLRHPLLAVPLFLALLYTWHFAFAFEGALRSPWLHAVQHLCFVAGATLVWWPIIEPDRARLPGALWKVGHITSARILGMLLGVAFLFMQTPAYYSYYGEGTRDHGLTPLADQRLAGGMMMILDLLVIVAAMSYFFWRAAAEHDREEAAERERRDADEHLEVQVIR